eukprot:3550987-Prymnesium_polylepis.1
MYSLRAVPTARLDVLLRADMGPWSMAPCVCFLCGRRAKAPGSPGRVAIRQALVVAAQAASEGRRQALAPACEDGDVLEKGGQ